MGGSGRWCGWGVVRLEVLRLEEVGGDGRRLEDVGGGGRRWEEAV